MPTKRFCCISSYSLSADPVAAGDPDLVAPTLPPVVVGVTADGVETGLPVVGNPTLGQTHVLSAAQVTSGDPSTSSAVLSQQHTLAANGIVTSEPSIGGPLIGQGNSLLAASTSGAYPSVGNAAISQSHALAATGVVGSSPILSDLAMFVSYACDGDDVSAGSSGFSSTGIGQSHVLVAAIANLDEPITGLPFLGQNYTLSGMGLDSGLPTMWIPSIGIELGFDQAWAAQSNILVGL